MTSGFEGGCLCGSTRFRVLGEPVAVALCHCTMCRRASAAPVVSWAMFPVDAFAWSSGDAARFASSPGVERRFCGHCGTPLTFTADFMPGLVDVTVGSFDDPSALPPQMHIWHRSRLPWLHVTDELPRHAELPPAP